MTNKNFSSTGSADFEKLFTVENNLLKGKEQIDTDSPNLLETQTLITNLSRNVEQLLNTPTDKTTGENNLRKLCQELQKCTKTLIPFVPTHEIVNLTGEKKQLLPLMTDELKDSLLEIGDFYDLLAKTISQVVQEFSDCNFHSLLNREQVIAINTMLIHMGKGTELAQKLSPLEFDQKKHQIKVAKIMDFFQKKHNQKLAEADANYLLCDNAIKRELAAQTTDQEKLQWYLSCLQTNLCGFTESIYGQSYGCFDLQMMRNATGIQFAISTINRSLRMFRISLELDYFLKQTLDDHQK